MANHMAGNACTAILFAYSHNNTTKLKAHLAMVPKARCEALQKAPAVRSLCGHVQETVGKPSCQAAWKKISQKAGGGGIMEARNAKGVEAMLSAGATRNAIKAKQALDKAGLKAPPPGSDAKLQSYLDSRSSQGRHTTTPPWIARSTRSFTGLVFLSVSLSTPISRQCLKLARNASADYEPPSRNAIGGHLLKQEYEARYNENIEKLLKEIETYGGAIFCDAATIHKSPLVNVLGSGVHLPNAVLEIHDCTGHMTEGGKKDAEYLFKLVMKHIKKLDPSTN